MMGVLEVDEPDILAKALTDLRTGLLAYPFLSRDRAIFERLEGAWEAISPARVSAYRDYLPDTWPGKKPYFPIIESYLHDLQTKLASAFDAITLTLPASP